MTMRMITSTRRIPHTRRPAPGRRGVAMLLVVIALGTATALTSVYLSSRRNSGMIGRNAAGAAGAQWAARSTVDLAVAIMQTNAEWRLHAADGVLFDNTRLSGATVAALVHDAEGNEPDDDDSTLIVTGVARSGGVVAAAQRVVNTIPEVTLAEALNPELDEHAIYVVDTLEVGAGSVVAVRPDSPLARLRPPVKIGVRNGSAGAFTFDPTSSVMQGMAMLPPDAGGALLSRAGDPPFVGEAVLPVDIPLLAPSIDAFSDLPDLSGPITPGDLGGAPGFGSEGGGPPGGGRGPGGMGPPGAGGLGGAVGGGGGASGRFTGVGASGTLDSGWYRDLIVENGAVVTLGGSGGVTRYSVEDLEVANDGVLRIVGAVEVQVRNDARVRDRGAVELADAASSLRLIVHGDMDVEDAGVGVARAVARDPLRAAEDVPADADPRRIRVYTTPEAPISADQRVRIDRRSVVVAALHTPRADVEIDDGALLVGRVTARALAIDAAGALLYDPRLDNHAGLTSPNGPLYTRAGDPIEGLADAFSTITGDITIETLDDHVGGFIDTTIFNTLDLTGSLINSLLGGGGSATDASPRHGSLAEPSVWPNNAFSLEADRSALISRTSGAFNELDDSALAAAVQRDDASINTVNTTGGGGGGGGGGGSLGNLTRTSTLLGEED